MIMSHVEWKRRLKPHLCTWLRVTSRIFLCGFLLGITASAQQAAFKVLAFYSTKVEPDHVQFANGALTFFGDLAAKNNFTFESTTDWGKLNEENLKQYRLIVWINDFPNKSEQRVAFQHYMEQGGGWLGFHVSAYNDKSTNWPWFVDFLGGTVFYANSWPPLPAKLIVDVRAHPVTRNLPATFTAPSNEWYLWKPSPRLNKNVTVLVTLDPANYPLGVKDILTGGDLPVVWTNTKYRMLYMNMGHGDKIFTDATQNQLIADGLLWLGGRQ
jgi:type 1 glutamine amidotransferase